jgi:hypothetical protein
MKGYQALRRKDGGRTQRGLVVVLGCALVWGAALWLGLRLI